MRRASAYACVFIAAAMLACASGEEDGRRGGDGVSAEGEFSLSAGNTAGNDEALLGDSVHALDEAEELKTPPEKEEAKLKTAEKVRALISQADFRARGAKSKLLSQIANLGEGGTGGTVKNNIIKKAIAATKGANTAAAAAKADGQNPCPDKCYPGKGKVADWKAACADAACKACDKCGYCHNLAKKTKECFDCKFGQKPRLDAEGNILDQVPCKTNVTHSHKMNSGKENTKKYCTSCHSECGHGWTPYLSFTAARATTYNPKTKEWRHWGRCLNINWRKRKCEAICANGDGTFPTRDDTTYLCVRACQGKVAMAATKINGLNQLVKGDKKYAIVLCNLEKTVTCVGKPSSEVQTCWKKTPAGPCPDRHCTVSKKAKCVNVCKKGAQNAKRAIPEQKDLPGLMGKIWPQGEKNGPVHGTCHPEECSDQLCATFASVQ